jgi:hypothetical protein
VLTEYGAQFEPAPNALLFGTSAGRQQGPTNSRRRVLAKAVEHADEERAKQNARQMDRRDVEPVGSRALVEGRDWVATDSADTKAAQDGAAVGAEHSGNRL